MTSRPALMMGVMMGWCVVLGAVVVQPAAAQPGAPAAASVDDAQVVKAAQFAVSAQQEAMKGGDQAGKLTLVKVLAARKQVVAGLNYILTLQVKQGDKVRTAEVKVWEQAWRKEPYQLTSWKFTDDKGQEEPKPAAGKDAGEADQKKSKFDPVADFSQENNPSGAWAYGYLDKDGEFHPYTFHGKFGGPQRTSFLQWSEKDPKHRGTDILVNQDFSPPNGPLYPRKELVLGANMANEAGDRPTLRWTAPKDGTVKITGTITGLKVSTQGMPGVRYPNQTFFSRGTAKIASGKDEVMTAPLNQKAGAKTTGNTAPIACTREVKAGDTIDFLYESQSKDVCGASLKIVVAFAPSAGTK